jgi:predicted Ser/Thr protein kinase
MEPGLDMIPGGDSSFEEFSSLKLIDRTYHSSIHTCQWKGEKVVVKISRKVEDPRSLPKWRNEVSLLARLCLHVSAGQLA